MCNWFTATLARRPAQRPAIVDLPVSPSLLSVSCSIQQSSCYTCYTEDLSTMAKRQNAAPSPGYLSVYVACLIRPTHLYSPVMGRKTQQRQETTVIYSMQCITHWITRMSILQHKLVSLPAQQRIVVSSKPMSRHRLCWHSRAITNNAAHGPCRRPE